MKENFAIGERDDDEIVSIAWGGIKHETFKERDGNDKIFQSPENSQLRFVFFVRMLSSGSSAENENSEQTAQNRINETNLESKKVADIWT